MLVPINPKVWLQFEFLVQIKTSVKTISEHCNLVLAVKTATIMKYFLFRLVFLMVPIPRWPAWVGCKQIPELLRWLQWLDLKEIKRCDWLQLVTWLIRELYFIVVSKNICLLITLTETNYIRCCLHALDQIISPVLLNCRGDLYPTSVGYVEIKHCNWLETIFTINNSQSVCFISRKNYEPLI